MQYSIEKYGTVTSTNDIVKEKAAAGAPEGTVVLADRQTAGRGRLGRQFFSPDASGLYMSILLRPRLAAADALSITTLAAVAVAEAIEAQIRRNVQIKWVNDIYLDAKKVCGILAEGQAGTEGSLAYAVLGIGINLTEPQEGFPDLLRDIAGSVCKQGESCDREKLMWDILQNFSKGYACLADKPHYDGYASRSMLQEKTVTVFVGGEPRCTAEVLGITSDFGLRVRMQDGSETVLQSGEVSVKIQ